MAHIRKELGLCPAGLLSYQLCMQHYFFCLFTFIDILKALKDVLFTVNADSFRILEDRILSSILAFDSGIHSLKTIKPLNPYWTLF
ncbi:MAG: hypothetical protein A4E23_00342 [Methanomethylovorans sp. PtaU1.Bin073]|nr:MAG: hypothetical protein A4E23_00342 [Methanomethylovorans sp. PtaU1.Bin073]